MSLQNVSTAEPGRSGEHLAIHLIYWEVGGVKKFTQIVATTYANGSDAHIHASFGETIEGVLGSILRGYLSGNSDFHRNVPLLTPSCMLQDNATELDNDDYDPILTLQLYCEERRLCRLGGPLVELKIAPIDGAPPFFFVSDNWTATNVMSAIADSCGDFTISDPIEFNSTGNIGAGNVVQFYREDSAAIVLQGYENALELPDRPDLVSNPPFPPTVNMAAWSCLNSTIEKDIPLLGWPRYFHVIEEPPTKHPNGGLAHLLFLVVQMVFFGYYLWKMLRSRLA